MKKLSNTESELKKSVAYKKKTCNVDSYESLTFYGHIQNVGTETRDFRRAMSPETQDSGAISEVGLKTRDQGTYLLTRIQEPRPEIKAPRTRIWTQDKRRRTIS